MSDLLIVLSIYFYGFIAVTLAALIFTIVGIIKIARGKCKSNGAMKRLRTRVCWSGAFVILVASISTFFLIRAYSLPVVCRDESGSVIFLNGEQYVEMSSGCPSGANLKLVARDAMTEKILTPEWAIEVLLNNSYYMDKNNDHFLYFHAVMEWFAYEKVTG